MVNKPVRIYGELTARKRLSRHQLLVKSIAKYITEAKIIN